MDKLALALKSRTVWTIVAMFMIGGVQNVEPFMPSTLAVMVQTMLGALAVYFKLKPSQDYNPKA